ncbi:MAG: SH3 domain-containing protein [Deltaproteobacteria bacterium]|nr:SH3 domain-containing protein [Candidatus Zymogenaceae bacterium]
MNPKKHLIFIVFPSVLMTAVVLPSLFAAAEEATDFEVVPCEVGAYVIDTDPAGLNVRSGPGLDYPVIAVLPTYATPPEDVTVDLVIRGSVGEWMYISDPAYDGSEGEEFWKITGWVYGPMLGTYAVDYGTTGAVVPVYGGPSTGSAVLTRLVSDTEVVIVGCRGEWVKVRVNDVEGWLAPGSHCGSSKTNCC